MERRLLLCLRCRSAAQQVATPNPPEWHTRRLGLRGLKLTIVWASSPTLSAHRLPIHISVPCKHGYYRQIIHNSRVLRSQRAKGVSIKTQPSHCGGKSRVPGATVLWSRTGRLLWKKQLGRGGKKGKCRKIKSHKVLWFLRWLFLPSMIVGPDVGLSLYWDTD